MMIFIPLLTPTRWLLHHQLPAIILSTTPKVIEPSGPLARLLLLNPCSNIVPALNWRIFSSLLVHLEQLIVVLARSTRVYLQSLFIIRRHSLAREAALGVWRDTQELPIVAVSHCFYCIVLMSRLFLSHGIHLLCQLVDLTKVLIRYTHLLSGPLKVWSKTIRLLRAPSMRKFW
jgi:hypothetical protein